MLADHQPERQMTVRVAQISDTHLSETRPFFHANFERVAAHLRSAAPDLVVNSGDLSLDGADSDADLRRAKEMHDAIGPPWLAIPGNHDIGDNQRAVARQPVSDERIARYTAVFGADRWTRDIPGWRLVGVNAQLLGADLPAAAAQRGFVRDAVAGAEGRAIALFIHKPLFNRSAAETTIGGRFLPPAPRAELLEAIGGADLRLVACGHVHQHRVTHVDGGEHVWAPSTAFVLPDSVQPEYGRKLMGYVEHDFHADGRFESRLVQPEGLVRQNLADVPAAYGNIRPRQPAAGSAPAITP